MRAAYDCATTNLFDVNFERRKLRRVLEWRFMPIVSVAQ